MSFFPLVFFDLPGQSVVDLQPPVPDPPVYNATYSNTSGINVSINGNIDSVHAVLDALTQNPPILGSTQNMPAHPPPQMPQQINVPSRTTTINGNLVLNYNNRSYSQSGIVIIVKDRNNQSYVVLFKNASNEYQELGGTLDSGIVNNNLSQPEKALFENAKKQAYIGSSFTFDIKTQSQNSINTTIPDQTLYKVYLFIIRVNDILDISNAFKNNLQKVQAQDSFVDIKFVKTSQMQHNFVNYNISILQQKQIISSDGTSIKCNSRTLEILKQMANIWDRYTITHFNTSPIRNDRRGILVIEV